MPAIEIGGARIGVVLGLHIFDEFFRELFASGVIASELTFPLNLNPDVDDTDDVLVTLRLEPPSFTLVRPEGEPPFTQLHLTGALAVRFVAEPQADPFQEAPLDVKVRLALRLEPRAGDTPVLRLVYEGVAAEPGAPVTADQVDALFQRPEIVDLLTQVAIDVVGPLVDGLEAIFFPEGDPPVRDAWPTAVSLLPAETPGVVEAVAVTVAQAGEDPEPGEVASFLPIRTGFGLVFSRSLLDVVLAAGAAERVGDDVCGAKITELELRTDGTVLRVEGAVKKSGVTVRFDGPIRPHLVRGTTSMVLDTDDVEVDTPGGLAGFLRFLGIFLPFAFPPLIFAVPKIWDAAEDLDEAPDTVRRGLAAAMAPALMRLAEGLAIETDVAGVTLESTPDRLEFRDGAFLFLAQVFVSPIEDGILHGLYSPDSRRFELFRLLSGRKFRATELARLVAAGKIVLPGFHDVGGRYMRADPDDVVRNNLLARFGELVPDEPILLAADPSADHDPCA